MRLLWAHLPLLIVPWAVLASALGCLVALPQPRPELVVTALVPCAVLAVVLAALVRAPGRPFPWLRWAALAALLPAAVLVVLLTVPGHPRAEPLDQVIRGYEAINLGIFLVLAWHCWRTRGLWPTVVLIGVGLVYGMCLESSGILLGVFSEDGYHWHVPGFRAPLATMLGWVTVFYPCVAMLEVLGRGFPALARWSLPARAALLSGLAVAVDLQVDPYATALGLWSWHPAYAASGCAHWFGVPLVNFASWFAAVAAFGLFTEGPARTLPAASPKRRAAVLVLAVPACMAVAAVLEIVLVVAVEGPRGPSAGILGSFLASLLPR